MPIAMPNWPHMALVSVTLKVQVQWQCHEHGRNTCSINSSNSAPTAFSDRDSARVTSRDSVTRCIRDGRDGAKAGRQSVYSTVPTRAGCEQRHPAHSLLLFCLSIPCAKRPGPDPAVRSTRALRLTPADSAQNGSRWLN